MKIIEWPKRALKWLREVEWIASLAGMLGGAGTLAWVGATLGAGVVYVASALTNQSAPILIILVMIGAILGMLLIVMIRATWSSSVDVGFVSPAWEQKHEEDAPTSVVDSEAIETRLYSDQASMLAASLGLQHALRDPGVNEVWYTAKNGHYFSGRAKDELAGKLTRLVLADPDGDYFHIVYGKEGEVDYARKNVAESLRKAEKWGIAANLHPFPFLQGVIAFRADGDDWARVELPLLSENQKDWPSIVVRRLDDPKVFDRIKSSFEEMQRYERRPSLVASLELRDNRPRKGILRIQNLDGHTMRLCRASLVSVVEELPNRVQRRGDIQQQSLVWDTGVRDQDIAPGEVVSLSLIEQHGASLFPAVLGTRLSDLYPTVLEIRITADDTPALDVAVRVYCKYPGKPEGGWGWEIAEGAEPRASNPYLAGLAARHGTPAGQRLLAAQDDLKEFVRQGRSLQIEAISSREDVTDVELRFQLWVEDVSNYLRRKVGAQYVQPFGGGVEPAENLMLSSRSLYARVEDRLDRLQAIIEGPPLPSTPDTEEPPRIPDA